MRYLNFGVSYDPDLVILAFVSGNDFRNNSRFLNRETIGFYYRFDEQHNLILDRSLVDAYERTLTYPKRLFGDLKSKSHLLSLISERVYLLRRQLMEDRMAAAFGKEENNALDLFSDLNIYRRDLPSPWEESIDLTKAIILKFKKSVEDHGAQFILLGLSSPEQVHPDIGRELKGQYNVEFDYDQPDRILEEFAEKHGLTFLKLMPHFREYHVRSGRYLHGFGSSHAGHWNQEGHRLASELTFQFLLEKRLIPVESTAK
jgi:hypothetical protein